MSLPNIEDIITNASVNFPNDRLHQNIYALGAQYVKELAEIEIAKLRTEAEDLKRRLNGLVLQGTDGCKTCETGRVSMYVTNKGYCISCMVKGLDDDKTS